MMPAPNPGMPAAVGPPPAVVYVPMPAQPTVYISYPSKQSIATGIVQLVVGVLCIILNIAAMFDLLGFIAHGFWCGIMFIVTGSFGIAAGQGNTKCKVTAYMVLCIISACFTAPLFALGIIGALFGYLIGEVTQSLLAVLAIVEAIFAIYGAVICCKSVPACCCYPDPLTVTPGYIAPNNGQTIFINQTQAGQCVYLQQPMMNYPSAPPPPFAPSNTQSGYPIPPPYSSVNNQAFDPN